MKRLCVFILVIALSLMAFVGCDRSYDEGEVKFAARALLEKSLIVNEIFYGEGIPYDVNSEFTKGSYSPADKEYLSYLGVSTTEGLKGLARGVYTNAICEIIFSTKLSSIKDGEEGGIVAVKRYYDATQKDGGNLMVYTEAKPTYDNEIEYLYETLTVVGADGELIKIEIDVLLTSKIGEKRTTRIDLHLLEEDNGFRLDEWSFVKY